MRAWLQDELITVEGTPEEWRKLKDWMSVAYRDYVPDRAFREFSGRMKKLAERGGKLAVSNTRPDLEWYDKHLK